jgi:hypothetical protein
MNQIPDRYISQSPNAMSHPTRLQYPESPRIEVEATTFDPSVRYYVVEFSDQMAERNVYVPLTFLG